MTVCQFGVYKFIDDDDVDDDADVGAFCKVVVEEGGVDDADADADAQEEEAEAIAVTDDDDDGDESASAVDDGVVVHEDDVDDCCTGRE